MNVQEIVIDTRNWIYSAQDRDYWGSLVNAALIFLVPEAMELINRTRDSLAKCPRCLELNHDIPGSTSSILILEIISSVLDLGPAAWLNITSLPLDQEVSGSILALSGDVF